MNKQFKKRVRKYIHKLAETNTTEHDIAIGFSIGTFIAIIPTPFFNIILGLLVVFIYKKVNKLALFGAMALWNPITNIPLTILSYKIGDIIFGGIAIVKYDQEIVNIILNFSRKYLLGNFIIAIVLSVVSYFVVVLLVRMYRERAKARKSGKSTQKKRIKNSSKR